MTKCKYCSRDICNENEIVKIRPPGAKRRITVHLGCYLTKTFTHISDRAVAPTDPVGVDPNGVCPWCRGYYGPVAHMSRTGQAICLKCLYLVLEIISRWYAENIEFFRYKIREGLDKHLRKTEQ